MSFGFEVLLHPLNISGSAVSLCLITINQLCFKAFILLVLNLSRHARDPAARHFSGEHLA